MIILNMMETMSALSGIAVIAAGSLWLKAYLKRCF